MNPIHGLKSGQKALSVQIYALFIIVVILAVVGLVLLKSSTNEIYNRGFHDFQNSTKLIKDIYQVHSSLYRIQTMVSTGQDKQEIAKRSNESNALLQQDVALVKKILDSDISSEQKKYYEAVMSNLTDYQRQVTRVLKLLPQGTGVAYLSAAEEKMEAITRLLSQLLDMESKIGADAYSSSSRNFYIIVVLMLVLLAAGVVASSILVTRAFGALGQPISETASVLREYADGKYSRTLSWSADDEMGDLAQSVNALKTKLSTAGTAAAKAPSGPAAPAASAAPAAPAEEAPKSLSGLVKKGPEAKDSESLVISPKKAIDKLQDI